jgi:hypothetical protein
MLLLTYLPACVYASVCVYADMCLYISESQRRALEHGNSAEASVYITSESGIGQ